MLEDVHGRLNLSFIAIAINNMMKLCIDSVETRYYYNYIMETKYYGE